MHKFIQVNFVSSSSLTGPLYYIYMALLAVFCTNTINIYAGINGLESGQTVVAGASVAVFNIIELSSYNTVSHYISLCLLLPFIATSLALYYHNRYGNCVSMLLCFIFPNYLTHFSLWTHHSELYATRPMRYQSPACLCVPSVYGNFQYVRFLDII